MLLGHFTYSNSEPTICMQPYISKPSYDKHPDRMCLTARLFGVNAPLLGSSNNHHDSNQGGQHRVTILELGCGTGSDLIPMALGLPQCEFIGIDASKDMIQTASTTASRLGLQNIRFLQEDITKLSMSLALASQKFDYIIAHGVLSWVDKHTRECILKFCADNLADNGVCYISCNMLPGCEIRDFLRQEFKKIDNVKDTPTKRVLRLREFLSEFAHSDKKQEHLPFQLSRLSTEAKNILALSDEYLLYDVLSESTAFFFQDLAHLVTSSGLRYLGDSKLKRVGFLKGIDLGDNSQNTTETFGDESVTCSEQEADLSRLEMFRANLFGKNSANIVRKPDLSVIENCFLSTVLTYNEDNFGETFFFSPNDSCKAFRMKRSCGHTPLWKPSRVTSNMPRMPSGRASHSP